MTIRSSRHAGSCALVLVLLVSRVSAQPTMSPADTARALYVEGKDLRRMGNLERSLEKLEAAHAAYATPVTALEAARGHALLGQYKKAVSLLESITALDVKPTESLKSAEARAEAPALVGQYRARLCKIHMSVEPDSARVLVDGEEVSGDARSAWLVDPGLHHVVAELGEQRTTDEIRVSEGEDRALSLVLRAPEAAPVLVPSAQPAPAALTPPPVAPPHDVAPKERTTNPLVYVGLGVAAAGTVTGVITGIMTLSRASTLERDCQQGACLPDAHLQTAQTLGTISTVAFAVGGAGLLLGLGALVLGGHPPEPRPVARVSPWLGANGAGLRGTFR